MNSRNNATKTFPTGLAGVSRTHRCAPAARRFSFAVATAAVICMPAGVAHAWDGPNYRCAATGTGLESAECSPGDDWKNMFDGKSLKGWEVKAKDSEKAALKAPYTVAYPDSIYSKIRMYNGGLAGHGYQNLEYIGNRFDDQCGAFEFITKVYGAPGQRGGTGIQFASHWNQGMQWYSGPQVDVELQPDAWYGAFLGLVNLGEFGFWRTGFVYDEFTTSADANAWGGNDSTWAYPRVPKSQAFRIFKSDIDNRNLQPAGSANQAGLGLYPIKDTHPMKNNPTGAWHTVYVKWEPASAGAAHNRITTIVNGKKIVEQVEIPFDDAGNAQHGGRWGSIALQLHRQLPFNDKTTDVHFKGLYFKSPGVSNLALGKATSQSTNYDANAWLANVAVDGNTVGTSITHTSLQNDPWWQVNLGGGKKVQGVTVWNRTDCCTERLSTFTLSYRDVNGHQIATENVTWPAHNPRAMYIPLAVDNVHYVVIQAFGSSRYLSLAEVQVWGKEMQEQTCAAPANAPWR